MASSRSSISNAIVAILFVVLISVSQVAAHNGVDHGHHAPAPAPTMVHHNGDDHHHHEPAPAPTMVQHNGDDHHHHEPAPAPTTEQHNGADDHHHAPAPAPTTASSAATEISASSMVTALFASVGFIVSMFY